MANLMELVRELKALNARKKAGQALPREDEARRKELKAFLREALEQQGSGSSLEDSAIKESSAQRTGSQRPVPSASSAPKPVPSASSAPKPVPSASSAPKPVPSASSAPKPRPASSLTMADLATAATARPTSKPSGPVAAPFIDDDVIPDPPKAGGAAIAAPFVDDEIVPNPPKKQAPAPYVPRKDAFAIDASVAGSLIGNAMKSDAVAKVDPLSMRQAHASRVELEEVEALADAAARANKKRERAKDAEEAVVQLQATEASYTPPETNLALEQYYGSYADEGYALVDAASANGIKPIDPREIELQKLEVAGGAGGSGVTITVPPGLAFLDDFAVLYAKRILPPPDDEVVVDSTDPDLLIPGKRKVTVHLLNGEKRQGAIRALRRGELGFKLEPLGSGQTEELSIAQCKAVFIHLQANQAARGAPGRSLTVTFRDARSVQGVSDDYQPGAPVFTLVPPAGRGQFERIIVNAAAVQSVA